MSAADEEWSVSANDVVNLSQVRNGGEGLDTIAEFSPTFTYPIFGEAEQIFGYKGLEIDLKFAAHDGSPHVEISYDKKFPGIKSTQALDLNETLGEFLPESAFEAGYSQRLKSNDTKDWHPPGELVHKYSKRGKNFEIWAGSLLNPEVNRLVRNIQVLVLFYIEAGSLLNLDEVDWSLDRWRVYFVYEKDSESSSNAASSYILLGYSTTYRFWTLSRKKRSQGLLDDLLVTTSLSPKQMDARLRISQFLLLPPYQKAGHGSQLYQAIYNEALQDPTIIELSVEDPSEEFDQLRDSCDWKVLEPQFRKANISIDAEKPMASRRIPRVPTSDLLPLQELKTMRIANKIAPRQFARLTELFLLSLIPFSHRNTGGASLTKLKIKRHTNKDPEDRKYYWWRIIVKQRIYRKNKDTLLDMDFEDKYTAIETSTRGQEDEYEGLLMLFALRQAGADTGNGAISAASSRKRKVVEEDSDEDDDDEEVEEVEVSLPKRAKR